MLQALAVMVTILVRALRSLGRPRADLIVENLALRQQLAALTRTPRRLRLEPVDRTFWVALREGWSRWADVLVVAKPDTVVAWHRRAFRGYWRWTSRRTGRPRVAPQLRTLIRRVAQANPTWGPPRIHGELLALGVHVAERTVSRHLRHTGSRPRAQHDWRTFLQNRAGLATMDVFTVPTASFRVLYVWFVLHHDRRRVLHVNVTAAPTAAWVCPQLREAFPDQTAPRYLLHDRAAIVSVQVRGTLTAMGSTPKRISYRRPWQNGAAEHWVGSGRRELLEHVIVLGEQHLRRLLREYLAVLWAHPQIRVDILELLDALAGRVDHLHTPLVDLSDVPLQIHARYSSSRDPRCLASATGRGALFSPPAAHLYVGSIETTVATRATPRAPGPRRDSSASGASSARRVVA